MTIRSMGTATIAFGLVAIPVKIYLGVKPEQIEFNGLTTDGHRVKQKLVDGITAEEVDRDDLLKGYEYARGQYVTFTADELASAVEGPAGPDKTIQIEACVRASDVKLHQVEKTYYLGPDKGGDKAYCLMTETLEESGRLAIAQWSTRGREHLVAVRSHGGGLIMHTLYYADEVRDQGDVTGMISAPHIGEPERELARLLIDRMAGSFDLGRYRDRYRERILAAVEAKVAGKEIVLPAMPDRAHVVDLYEALKKSIAEATAAAPKSEPKASKAKGKPKAKRPRKVA